MNGKVWLEVEDDEHSARDESRRHDDGEIVSKESGYEVPIIDRDDTALNRDNHEEESSIGSNDKESKIANDGIRYFYITNFLFMTYP